MLDPDRLSFAFEVPPVAAPTGRAHVDNPRLDEFIAARLPKVSLTRIRRLIAEGEVLVDGAASVKGARLAPGARVTVKLFAADPSSATPEAIPLDILFEDEHLIVINKQAGLLVHPSPRERSGTLLNALAFHFWETSGEAIRPGLVHRLDRDTSGVIVVAKTPRAHRTLSKHFHERWVKKFYLAVVSGRVEPDRSEIDAPIGADKKTWPHWRVLPEAEGGRAAKTLFTVKRRFAAHTLLELEPLTGRTHQLRIHCKLIGHPILGDPFYASTPDPAARALGLKHHFLHAARLEFRHPAMGKPLVMEAPLPQAMQALLAKL